MANISVNDKRQLPNADQPIMKFFDALQQLSAGAKAKRLHSLFPAIEQKLAEGVSHKAILALLNASGFDLSERTYKSYLYRYRKRRRTSAPERPKVKRLAQAPAALSATDDSLRGNGQSPSTALGQPKTFEFNAGGLPPDLLK